MSCELKSNDVYCGYRIAHRENAPVTGRWRGERFGVGMCAGTIEQLKRMIDQKCLERTEQRQGATR